MLYEGLTTIAALSVRAEEQTNGFPWWAILLLLVIIIVILIWALTRSTRFSEEEAPHVEHAPIDLSSEVTRAEPVIVAEDDLKIIEGIGPKISSLLKGAGIQTFAQLADTDPETIRKILFDVDPRLGRLGDPTTWPAQAKLAAEGKMSELQALQDSLKGGRLVN